MSTTPTTGFLLRCDRVTCKACECLTPTTTVDKEGVCDTCTYFAISRTINEKAKDRTEEHQD